MDKGFIGALEMEQELRRLKGSIDLSCVNDIEFLRHYVELLDVAYMQQAGVLRDMKQRNQDLWESNERITKELRDEITELGSTREALEGKLKEAECEGKKRAVDNGDLDFQCGVSYCARKVREALPPMEKDSSDNPKGG